MSNSVRSVKVTCVYLLFTLVSCSGNFTSNSICPVKTASLALTDGELRLNETALFLDNWNGLTGVIVEPGKSCKVQVEIVPNSEGYKAFLWSKTDCMVASETLDLYLAFKPGYFKTSIKRYLPASLPSELITPNMGTIYEPEHAISNVLGFNYGEGESSSYDLLGHVVDEFQFLPAQQESRDILLNLVVQAQLKQRAKLIPGDLVQHVEAFRDFFLRTTILRRSLIKFSQDFWYRMGHTIPAIGDKRQEVTDQLASSVNQDIWAEVQNFFHPSNQSIDYSASLANEVSRLNDSLVYLLESKMLWLRVPGENQVDLLPESVGMKASFNDSSFEFHPVGEVDHILSPLALSDTLSGGGYLQLTGLQPSDFCSGEENRFFRMSRHWTLSGGDESGVENSVFVGVGSAEISFAGFIPLARKRPQSKVCPNWANESGGWQSGGAAVLSIPDLPDFESGDIAFLNENQMTELMVRVEDESNSTHAEQRDEVDVVQVGAEPEEVQVGGETKGVSISCLR